MTDPTPTAADLGRVAFQTFCGPKLHWESQRPAARKRWCAAAHAVAAAVRAESAAPTGEGERRSDLAIALDESLKLQAHYAKLLNMDDGGCRMTFDSVEAWLSRLRECERIPAEPAPPAPAADVDERRKSAMTLAACLLEAIGDFPPGIGSEAAKKAICPLIENTLASQATRLTATHAAERERLEGRLAEVTTARDAYHEDSEAYRKQWDAQAQRATAAEAALADLQADAGRVDTFLALNWHGEPLTGTLAGKVTRVVGEVTRQCLVAIDRAEKAEAALAEQRAECERLRGRIETAAAHLDTILGQLQVPPHLRGDPAVLEHCRLLVVAQATAASEILKEPNE